MTNLTFDNALVFVENLSRQHRQGQGLTNLEIAIFQGIWEGLRFKDIAKTYPGAGLDHIQRNAAPKLYRFLSKATGEKVKAHTLKSIINQAYFRDHLLPSAEVLTRDIRAKMKEYIWRKCGTMRVLDMHYPIELDDIYTEVNILKKVVSKSYKELEDMIDKYPARDFNRLGYQAFTISKVSAIEAANEYDKLFILGKPGAGKTTFLKHLANQCIHGRFNPELVPIFIVLREFSVSDKKSGLLTYIKKEMETEGVPPEQVEALLKSGKALLLLDGLDEIKREESQHLIDAVQKLLNMFPINRCVITCRIAAQEYIFPEFTEVEVADFTENQIGNFVQKWFVKRKIDQAQDLIQRFHKKLNTNKSSKELASNPLFLTLLCLVFEDLNEFPRKRSELYKDGLDLLLKKWDSKRNIERSEIYKSLDTTQREDLLSYLAYTTFSQGYIFFRQSEIEELIIEYISSLPRTQIDPRQLRLDGEAVLKGIEANHGILVERAHRIYSFSHLTFQEYFTARQIVTSSNPEVFQERFNTLASQIRNKQWREVFLMTVELLPNADYLLSLMKKEADGIVQKDKDIVRMLDWLQQKSNSIEHPYKQSAVRATYLEHILDGYLGHFLCEDRSSVLDISIDNLLIGDVAIAIGRKFQDINTIKRIQGLEYGLDRTIDQDFDRDFYFPFKLGEYEDRRGFLAYAKYRDCSTILEDTLLFLDKHEYQDELKQELQNLKIELPSDSNSKTFDEWFSNDEGKEWTKRLRQVMVQYRNIGHDWQFSDNQHQLLKDYYNANLLLVQCLEQSRYVSRHIRKEIEDTLLLP
jgi:predicted NACHT family NTPase